MSTDCYLAAIKLLAKRDYSEYKLSHKLREKKFSKDEIAKTIQEVLDLNYLREDEYRKSRVQGLIRKAYAPDYIIQKMAQEFCETNEEEIQEIMNEMKFNQRDQIKYLVEKKTRGLSQRDYDQKTKEKVIRFLISKGHRYNDFVTLISDPAEN